MTSHEPETNPAPKPVSDPSIGVVRLSLLGGVDLRDGAGAEISPVLAQPKRLALLAYLATAPATRLRRRDALIGVLWSEMDETRARNSVNRSISFLRGWLGNDVIVSRGKEEVGVAPDRLWCDVAAFEAALAAGDRAAAMQHYAGDLLEGFYVARAPELEDWIQRERARLRRAACTVAWELATEAEKAGQFEVALSRARRAFELDLLDERALRRLLALLDRSGDRVGAVRVYDDFVRLLERDFEMEPSPETRGLMELVRSRVKAYATPRLPLASVKLPAVIATPARAASPAPVPPPVPVAPPVPVTPERDRPGRHTLVRWVAGIAAAAVTAAGTLASISRDDRPAAAATAGNIVLVLPFTHSGNGEINFLRDGSVEILSTNMMTPGVAAMVDPRAVRAYLEGRTLDLESSDAIAAAARHFQARYVVVGGVSELRGQLRLNAALLDMGAAVGGTRITEVDARGASTTAFDLFEDLSRQLLASLPGAGERGAARSTASLRALRAYLQGEQLYLQGRFAESLDAYQLAMREDSTFASAAYRFNVAGDWTGTVPDSVLAEALARALRHSERLSEPDRMLIQARAAAKQFDLDRADNLYMRVLRGQPNNVEAWYQLGDLRFHWGSPLGRSYRLSRDAFEHVRRFDPGNGPALIHLARIAAGDGERRVLDTLVRALKRLGPDERFAREADLLGALWLGDAAAQQRAVATTVAEGPQRSHDGARQSAAFTRELASAARLAAAYAEQGPASGLRREEVLALQALIELGRGRPAAARRLLPPSMPVATEMRALALTLPWISPNSDELGQVRRDLVAIRRDSTGAYVPRRVFLEGMLAIRAGDAASARAAIAQLRDARSVPAPVDGYAVFFAKVLAAAALQSQGRSADALAALGPATAVERTLPTPLGYPFIHARFLRATLLEETGKLDEALSWFATFPEPEGCDVPYRAAAYMARSRIHARMGMKDLARAEIAVARELWREAEPENARVLAVAGDYVNRE